MSDRARTHKPPKPAVSERVARRTEFKREAAARAAKQRRQRNALTTVVVVLAMLAVGGVIGTVVYVVKHHGNGKSTPGAIASATGVPLDPRLNVQPTVVKGEGELTKLVVTTLIEGQGDPVLAGETIKVNYIGGLYKTGEVFDSSWSRKQPFTFQVGANKVIAGWDQGLVGVKVGSRVQLDLPADLAYGDNPGNGAPGGPLRFVVDVLDAR